MVGEKGEVAYDKLVFGTGSSAFIIPCPGHDLPGVVTFRDLEDTDAMMQASGRPGSKAVVIGGGLLGLEAAAALRLRRGMPNPHGRCWAVAACSAWRSSAYTFSLQPPGVGTELLEAATMGAAATEHRAALDIRTYHI